MPIPGSSALSYIDRAFLPADRNARDPLPLCTPRRCAARLSRLLLVEAAIAPSSRQIELSFRIIGQIDVVETFAVGRSIRELPRLKKIYGVGQWRKRKGVATVRLPSGVECKAELHWYEATGIGRKEFKIKRLLVD